MKVWFENSHGVKREIATVETKEQAYEVIHRFCEERNFTIHYTRGWETKESSVVDVGSHTEFFHLTTD